MKSPEGSRNPPSPAVAAWVAAWVVQPSGYEMEIPWRVEVKVSDSAGATDGDAGVVDGAVDGATACDGTACDGAMACDGATLVAVEQPATTATTSRIETSMMNETRFIG